MCSNMEGSRGFGVVDVLVGALMGGGSGTGEVKQLLWEVSVVCSGERW